ncbi:hypothetical protein CI089_13360 [Microbacterium sp. Yaish 1]|nr:hypothetical protein CI089_13360 [Microbacterium sp. Yaish 1]
MERLERVSGNELAGGVQLVDWKFDFVAEFDVRSWLPLRQQSVQAVVHVPERYSDNIGDAKLVPPHKSVVHRVGKSQSPGEVGYRPLDQTRHIAQQFVIDSDGRDIGGVGRDVVLVHDTDALGLSRRVNQLLYVRERLS